MDGVAPESVQDGPLKEERHARGAPMDMRVLCLALEVRSTDAYSETQIDGGCHAKA